MNEDQKRTLLKVARGAVTAAVKHLEVAAATSDNPELNAHCGCFVTLKRRGRLRGCLGQFTSDRPLIELIAQMAAASATQDPRFSNDPVKPAELNQLDIEISVLSELRPADDPLSLRLGIDGIYVKKGWASGCFLPQVATETGWSREEFLSYCCSKKAGLAPDAWKQPDTTVYLFTAEVFGAEFREIP